MVLVEGLAIVLVGEELALVIPAGVVGGILAVLLFVMDFLGVGFFGSTPEAFLVSFPSGNDPISLLVASRGYFRGRPLLRDGSFSGAERFLFFCFFFPHRFVDLVLRSALSFSSLVLRGFSVSSAVSFPPRFVELFHLL